MYFDAMSGCCSMFILLHLDGHLVYITDRCHICFACHFQTVHPIPVFFISISTEITSPFQWHTWISKLRPGSFIFLSNLAYASLIAFRIAYHVCIMLFEHCTWLIVFLLLVCLVWVESGDKFTNEEPIEFVYEDQVNSDNFAGKMTIPLKSLLSLLARCLLFCYAYATMPTTCLSCLPNCHVKPLTHHVLANH